MEKPYSSNYCEKKCPICGKPFIAAPFHIYKANARLVCSWSCMLKFERETEQKNDRV
jgi:ribosome-binding protein aMBF1 (putative translation factor)